MGPTHRKAFPTLGSRQASITITTTTSSSHPSIYYIIYYIYCCILMSTIIGTFSSSSSTTSTDSSNDNSNDSRNSIPKEEEETRSSSATTTSSIIVESSSSHHGPYPSMVHILPPSIQSSSQSSSSSSNSSTAAEEKSTSTTTTSNSTTLTNHNNYIPKIPFFFCSSSTFIIQLWNWFCLFISIWHIMDTHTAIVQKSLTVTQDSTSLVFFLDVLLNFCTYNDQDILIMEKKRRNTSTTTNTTTTIPFYHIVWARYLTTWFLVDALALIPTENIYLQPHWEQQIRRHKIVKWWFRSKAIWNVTTRWNLYHQKRWILKLQHATGIRLFLSLFKGVIRYVPKYMTFFRNMKGVLLVRILRQFHYIQRCVIPSRTSASTEHASSCCCWEELQEDDNLPF